MDHYNEDSNDHEMNYSDTQYEEVKDDDAWKDLVAKDDPDMFLSSLESKLRLPYSSLDVTKLLTSVEYLNLAFSIFDRMAKPIKLRLLVSLYGIDYDDDNDDSFKRKAVLRILDLACQSHQDEWVRFLAGIIQTKLFQIDSSSEFTKKVNETCSKIFQPILQHINKNDTTAVHEKMEKALFAPHYLSLLPTQNPAAASNPHFRINQDATVFQVDTKLEAKLALEEKKELENQRRLQKIRLAKQQQQQQKRSASGLTATNKRSKLSAPSVKNSQVAALLLRSKQKTNARTTPGVGRGTLRSTTATPGKRGNVSLSGLGRGSAASRMGGRSLGIPQKLSKQTPMLRAGMMPVRSKASTRMLLQQSSSNTNTGTNNVTSKQPLASNKKKMKLMDVSEVEKRHKEQTERSTQYAQTLNREEKLQAKRKRILEKAAAAGIRAPKLSKKEETPKPEEATPVILNATVAGALSAYQAQVGVLPESITNDNANDPNRHQENGIFSHADHNGDNFHTSSVDNFSGENPTHITHPNNHANSSENYDNHHDASMNYNNEYPDYNNVAVDHLQGILEKSNKLTPSDRDRVLHFFQNRYNPTPDQPTYKMKLHEEKKEDDGIIMKETLYLELDYTTFGFKKTRKVKKK